MAGTSVGMQAILCKDCSKHNKAVDIYEQFSWECFGLMGFDKEAEEILLVEEQIMRIIQMVNPGQKTRKLKLVSQDELMRRK